MKEKETKDFLPLSFFCLDGETNSGVKVQKNKRERKVSIEALHRDLGEESKEPEFARKKNRNKRKKGRKRRGREKNDKEKSNKKVGSKSLSNCLKNRRKRRI